MRNEAPVGGTLWPALLAAWLTPLTRRVEVEAARA